MDPNATLHQWASAILRGDRAEANEAYETIRSWLERGGFEPEWTTLASRERFFSYNPRTGHVS